MAGPAARAALIVVDVQNDFLPGGALGVAGGDLIVPALNRCLAAAERCAMPIYATRDWHPPGHCSFHARGGIWPEHCVQDSGGAAFSPLLRLPPSAVIVSKGTTPDREAYSTFAGTGLAGDLRRAGIGRLFIGGLATDYCVLNSVRDAVADGFQVAVLRDAIAAVNVNAGDGARAEAEMQKLGARFLTAGEFADECARESAPH